MQGMISNHCYQFDKVNIQDLFISYLNNSAEILKIMNHESLSSLSSTKLSYLESLFLHTIGGLVQLVIPISCSTGFT